MTCMELLQKALGSDLDEDSVGKLIAIAYYIGREEATKRIIDRHNEIINEQRKRAAKSRYHNFADSIIGDCPFIYSGDYSGNVTATFGSDATSVTLDD